MHKQSIASSIVPCVSFTLGQDLADDDADVAEMAIDDGIIPRLAADAKLEPRWLGHMQRQEMFEQYQHWHLCNGTK